MKPRRCLLFITLFLSIAPAQGQNAASKHYDTENVIQLKGTITAVFFMGKERLGFLFLEVPDVNGKLEKWAVAGGSQKSLQEAGWVFNPPSPTLKRREVVTIVAYLPKPGVTLADLSPSVAAATIVPGLPSPAERFQAGRYTLGTEVTLSSGNKLVFGDLN